MRAEPEIMWAIKGREGYGFYSGTAFQRRTAIAQHVYAFDDELFNRGYPHYQSRPLDKLQKRVWAERKRRGDRAVKVEVSEL